MKKNLLAGLMLLGMMACSKDKFQTKPQISIKEYNSKTIEQGSDLEIRMNYTDKEGDIGEGMFYGVRMRQNIRPLSGADNNIADTLNYPIPTMPDIDKGELIMTLNYDFLKESTVENDTVIFKVAIKDRAGNASDTLTTDKIVILKN